MSRLLPVSYSWVTPHACVNPKQLPARQQPPPTLPDVPRVRKATKQEVRVNTEVGEQVYCVPSSTKQRDESPNAESWKLADKNALQVLLRAGNRLVPVSVPQSKGHLPALFAVA